MKKCWICKLEKDSIDFYKDSQKSDGLQKACKECQKKRNREYGKKNRDYFIKKNKDNYQNNLKENPDYNQQRYLNDKEKFLERRLEYSKTLKGKLKTLLTSAKGRSKSKRADFDLDFNFLLDMYKKQGGKCALTGLDFTFVAGHNKDTRGKYNPFNISLDKIDANKGYIKDNVRLVLVVVNISLNSFGDDVFDMISKAYISKKYGIII
jgi:hypothetical protein